MDDHSVVRVSFRQNFVSYRVTMGYQLFDPVPDSSIVGFQFSVHATDL
uniref:Uncharacterized protein n=1 Tax=Rhizophora mucronata TaxID=61149 RepID=A0A2P2N072_RHIMU